MATISEDFRTVDRLKTPVFSVVVATYNRSNLFIRALKSVFAQTFPSFEVLVIDDASTDNTEEVVSGFADSRLHYYRQPSNGGVGLARNVGIQQSEGKYIVFVDDDDTIEPSFLDEVYAVFSAESSTVGFLWTWKNVVRHTESNVEILQQLTFRSPTGGRQSGAKYLQSLAGGSGGLVVLADAFGVVGPFNTEFRTAGDTELLIRLAKEFDYFIIPKALYNIFAMHGQRLTKPSLVRAQSYERLIELHSDSLRHYPHTLCDLYKRCAKAYYQVGNRAMGHRFMARLIRQEPFNWKNWALWLFLENLNYLPRSLHQRAFATGRPL